MIILLCDDDNQFHPYLQSCIKTNNSCVSCRPVNPNHCLSSFTSCDSHAGIHDSWLLKKPDTESCWYVSVVCGSQHFFYHHLEIPSKSGMAISITTTTTTTIIIIIIIIDHHHHLPPPPPLQQYCHLCQDKYKYKGYEEDKDDENDWRNSGDTVRQKFNHIDFRHLTFNQWTRVWYSWTFCLKRIYEYIRIKFEYFRIFV